MLHKLNHTPRIQKELKLYFPLSLLQNLVQQHDSHLSLTVAAPGIDVSRRGQGQGMFAAHSNVLNEQPLQGWHDLGTAFVLQHGVWQANQTL